MGLRETLITDWKNKDIIYQGCEMYVVEQFEYEGVEYLYVIDKDSVVNENSKDIEVAFLYKVNDDEFANVDDENLFFELMGEVAGKMAVEKLKEIFK